MTVEESIRAMRVKWDHEPLDVRDVEERIALRMGVSPDVRVIGSRAECTACRVFVRHGETWRSRFVHTVSEVDAALDWCLEAPMRGRVAA